MAMRTVLVAGLLLAALVAGCSDGPKADEPTDQDFEGLGLEASDTTGVLRGVVVDSAIRPVPGVTIAVSGPTEATATTTADGLFGFDGLKPGNYFVRANKPGYQSAQQNAEVVAGVADPPIVKVLLAIDPSTAPYISTFQFDGYIECSFSLVAVGFAACSSLGDAGNDRFSDQYTPDRVADWAQSEMVWESTQAVSENLDLVYSIPPDGNQTLYYNYAEDKGPSPLTVQANKTTMEFVDVGSGQDLILRVFNEPVAGTRPADPAEGDDCLDRPQLGGCVTGVGFTVEQPFTIYTNVFYGFVPDPEWRFIVDGPYPLP
jgi:hypothetical protein